MKTLTNLFGLLFLVFVMTGCPLFDKKKDDVTPVDTTPEFQKAIEAKYKAIGWDKDGHTLFNGGAPTKTAGGKGYVQYYAFASRQTAIYYYPGKGAFAMDTEEMNAYDAVGQDKFAVLVSDPKPTLSGGCGYNDIILVGDGSEGIITCQNLVYGNIYKKYKEVNRWDGPLGGPTSSELDLSSKKGRFNTFAKGQIYWGATTGAQAFWGKVDLMYKDAGYDGGWLGLPTTSCDPAKGDKSQTVNFQGGSVTTIGACSAYFLSGGSKVQSNGLPPFIFTPMPCY